MIMLVVITPVVSCYIIRDPVHVLRSFAGLSATAVLAATDVDMLADANDDDKDVHHQDKDSKIQTDDSTASSSGLTTVTTAHCETKTFPQIMVDILSDMMERESKLYDDDDGNDDDDNPWHGRCHYVTFSDFQSNPVACLQTLYTKMDNLHPMTRQMEVALQSKDYLGQFESYKTRHAYQNPTLAAMKLDENKDFLKLSSVERYTQLLERRRRQGKKSAPR